VTIDIRVVTDQQLTIYSSDLNTSKVKPIANTHVAGIAIDTNQHLYMYETNPVRQLKVVLLESLFIVFIVSETVGFDSWPRELVNLAITPDGQCFFASNEYGRGRYAVRVFTENYGRLPDQPNDILSQRHSYRQLKMPTSSSGPGVPPIGWVGEIPLQLEGPNRIVLLRYNIEIALIGEVHYQKELGYAQTRSQMCPDNKFNMKFTDYVQLVAKHSKEPILLCIEKDPSAHRHSEEHTVLNQLSSISTTFHDVVDTITTEDNIRVVDVDARRNYGRMAGLRKELENFFYAKITDESFVEAASGYMSLINNFLYDNADMEFALTHTLPEIVDAIRFKHMENIGKISNAQTTRGKAEAFSIAVSYFLDFYALATMFHPGVSRVVFYGGRAHVDHMEEMLRSLGAEVVHETKYETTHCTEEIALQIEPHFFVAPLRSSFYSSAREHFALWLERPTEYFELSDIASTLSLLRYAKPCFLKYDDTHKAYAFFQLATKGQAALLYAESGRRFALFLFHHGLLPRFAGARLGPLVAVYVYNVYSDDIAEKLSFLKQTIFTKSDSEALELAFGSGSSSERLARYKAATTE